MRGPAWIVVLGGVAALAACSPKAGAPPAAPAPANPAAPPLPASSAPTPEDPPAAPVNPETTTAPAPASGPAATDPVVHFSPANFPARERRIAALINNAESRDTSGETAHVAEYGHTQRQHCTTRACIEQSYAAEEAWLRKWEGSSEIR